MNQNEYSYLDIVRPDILRLIPTDGKLIGSIGCGRGATEHVLVQQGRLVHGVDVSEIAIATASTRLTSATVVKPDNMMPFPGGSMDGLILADIIEHLPYAGDRLRELSKMVREGGWVVISVPNMRYIEVIYTFVCKGDWPEQPTGIFDYSHLQNMSHKRLCRWAKDAGLVLSHWHDSYDNRFWRRNLYRAIDVSSFRLFHGLLVPMIQGVFRKQG